MQIAKKNSQKLFLLVTFQFGLLVTLMLQCYGIAVVHKLLPARRNMLLCAYLTKKKKGFKNEKKNSKTKKTFATSSKTIAVLGGK